MLNEPIRLENKRIGWILAGDRTVASSRLQGYNIHEYLLENKIDSTIITYDFNCNYQTFSIKFLLLVRKILKERYDIVLFTTPNWMMYKLSQLLRLNDCKTIAVRCDYLPGPYDEYFDKTILPTGELKELLKINNGAIIEDMVEVPREIYKKDYSQQCKQLKVVWIGHESYKYFITQFIEKLSANKFVSENFEFITISKGSWATHQWQLETVFHLACKCDLAIIPMPKGDRFAVKSSNRLTMFMALGLPTIITPINSYFEVAENKSNCLISNHEHEFYKNLQYCTSQGVREKIGRAARQYANAHFAREIVGKKWLRTMETTLNESPNQVNENIHIRALVKALMI